MINQNRLTSFFRTWGSLLIWALTFLTGFMVKLFTFNKQDVWFDIAPEANLWATGILFAICISDLVFSRARVIPRYRRSDDGIGYDVRYDITLPNNYDLSSGSNFIYLFVIALLFWVINLFINGFAEQLFITQPAIWTSQFLGLTGLIFLSFSLATLMMCIALRSLNEVIQ